MNKTSAAPASSAIRAYLREHPRRTVGQVCAGMGVTDLAAQRKVGKAMLQMTEGRKPLLTRTGSAKPYRYSFVREPEPMSREHRLAVKRAKAMRHRRRMGTPTRAEYLAARRANAKPKPAAEAKATDPIRALERVAAAQQRAAEREATKRAKAEERAREKARNQAEREAVKPAPKPRPEAPQPTVRDRAPYQAREIATAPVREALPDTAAWLAANADRFERLPIGEVSPASRLRHDYRRRA